MNPFEQKAIFLWNVPQVENGDAQAIANILSAAGFTAVWVKAADGAGVFYSGWLNALFFRPNVTKAFVDVMHANGIAVAGWGFCYGLGDSEGLIAAQQVNALGLDGWIFDIESKFEAQINRVALAGQMIGTYNKNILKKVPTGVCSWAFFQSRLTGSQIHPSDHIKFLLGFCDYGLPMVYWNRLGTDGKPVVMDDLTVLGDLSVSVKQWQGLTDKTIIPVGRAYTGDGNVVKASNVIAFGEKAVETYPGYSFWSLEHAIKIPDVWSALSNLPNYGEHEPPPPPPDTLPVVTITEVLPEPAAPITFYGMVTQGNISTGFKSTYTPPVSPPPTPSPTPTPAPTYPPNTYLLPIALWSGTHGGATSPAPGPWTQPLTMSPPKADNHFNLSDRWLSYIRRWNTQADYDRIISPDFGPFAANGAYIALGYPGDNVVHVLEVKFIQGQDWGRIESIDTGQAPPVNVAPITHPWLFHVVRGADSAGKKWFDIGDYVVPLLSAPGKALWVPMKALAKL